MPVEHDIATRFLAGDDLWSPTPSVMPSATGVGYSTGPRSPIQSSAPALGPLPKILVAALLKRPGAQHATNAARPLSEFIQAQQQKAAKRKPQRRRRRVQLFDPRLWLNPKLYAAWTLGGEIVVVMDPEYRDGRGSPIVRRPTPKELHDLLAVDRLIERVIALYRGDSLEKTGVVSRYMQHYDVDGALQAALERALEVERLVAGEEAERRAAQASQKPKLTRRFKKSRFRPEGNHVIYYEPEPGDDLPPFAAIVFGPPVPRAFEDRRQAERAMRRLRRRGHLPQSCKVARVLGAVRARPVFRTDLKLPREPEKRVELLRREPRIVEPNLHLEWLPRFVQEEDGKWRPQEFRLRRTVRHGVRHNLLDELGEASAQAARKIDDIDLCRRVGNEGVAHVLVDELAGPGATAVRAQRGLPRTWQEDLGFYNTLGPDWKELAERSCRPPGGEDGHWVRASHEGTMPEDRTRRFRLVELRIDDLAGLLEEFGMEIEFWLVKDGTKAEPRWVMPVPEMQHLALS